MKKILFLLLLLPFSSIAQKKFFYDKALPCIIHIDSIQLIRNDTTIFITNAGWMDIEWLHKIVPLIYPKIEDMYRWNYDWEKNMKGATIPY